MFPSPAHGPTLCQRMIGTGPSGMVGTEGTRCARSLLRLTHSDTSTPTQKTQRTVSLPAPSLPPSARRTICSGISASGKLSLSWLIHCLRKMTMPDTVAANSRTMKVQSAASGIHQADHGTADAPWK